MLDTEADVHQHPLKSPEGQLSLKEQVLFVLLRTSVASLSSACPCPFTVCCCASANITFNAQPARSPSHKRSHLPSR